jgi:translation initiation factor IF-2
VAEVAPDSGPKHLEIKPPIVVKDFANLLGIKAFKLIHELMDLGRFTDLHGVLEADVARKIAENHGFILDVQGRGLPAPPTPPKPPEPEPVEEGPTTVPEVPARAPIIAFMGHVDHGKTSLMDAIRNTRVAAGEAGGITQHIGAYSVVHNKQTITFLDTPGHAAFSAMRARGANVTDIVVLVVAADDGLMPQTREAISHAKAANVKIIVAINKIDLPTADPMRVKQQLQAEGLAPEEWGGDVAVCEVSATKRLGIDRLLENMLVHAEFMELRASPKGPATGTVIEAQLEQGRGPTATIIVRTGTLRVGDAAICGDTWGKIKGMFDDRGKPIKEAGPSTPVRILGLSDVPAAGDELKVLPSDREARALSEERTNSRHLGKLEVRRAVTLENIYETLAADQKKALRIVLKGDVQGSVEAIVSSLQSINSEKVGMEILFKAVGPITESDVMLARASDAVIIGFNTRVENNASASAKRERVQIKLYSIIYELIDQIREAMAGLLDPILRESVIGRALCKQVIKLSKYPVAGSAVQSGRVSKSGRARVLRNGQPIYDGQIVTLKRFQDEVNEVRQGLECGIRLGDFDEYHVGDVIECYTLEKVPQSL